LDDCGERQDVEIVGKGLPHLHVGLALALVVETINYGPCEHITVIKRRLYLY